MKKIEQRANKDKSPVPKATPASLFSFPITITSSQDQFISLRQLVHPDASLTIASSCHRSQVLRVRPSRIRLECHCSGTCCLHLNCHRFNRPNGGMCGSRLTRLASGSIISTISTTSTEHRPRVIVVPSVALLVLLLIACKPMAIPAHRVHALRPHLPARSES